ncbi:hypothetical protein CSUI_006275 [Cystoisospora suis]|uniref:Uncharacterized protein n=1 Tax=Cystoisospora suis TaxID=483139 RepID=A0A2C6KUJ0_9APIC|nr:hypothetical protein CSUI_006275 [Cystoisospora suis]
MTHCPAHWVPIGTHACTCTYTCLLRICIYICLLIVLDKELWRAGELKSVSACFLPLPLPSLLLSSSYRITKVSTDTYTIEERKDFSSLSLGLSINLLENTPSKCQSQ